MRRPWSLALFLIFTAATCRKPPRPDTRMDAGPVTSLHQQPDAGLDLTLSMLDGFLAYERVLRGEAPRSPRDVRRLSQATDGGARGLEEAYAVMRQRTERAEALRVDAGLTVAEVRSLESLTAEVALARAGAGGADLEEALRSLDAAKEQLPAEQRAGVQRTLDRLRAQQERARTLSDVRARWGDPAVDTVLQRERAVLDLWGVPGR